MEYLGRIGIRKTIESLLERAENMSDTEPPESVESFLKCVNDTCWRNNIPISEYQFKIDAILGTTYAVAAEDLTKKAFIELGVFSTEQQKLRMAKMGEGFFIDNEGVVYIMSEDNLIPNRLTLVAYEKLKEYEFDYEIRAPVKYKIIDMNSGLKSIVVTDGKEIILPIATIAGTNSKGPYTIEPTKPEYEVTLKDGSLEVILKMLSAQFGKRNHLRIGKDGMLFILNDNQHESTWLPLEFTMDNNQIAAFERDFYEIARRGYDKNLLKKAINYAMKSKTMSKEYFREKFIPNIRELIKKSNSLYQDDLKRESYSLGNVTIPTANVFSN